jgi:hypothetical protein
MAIRHEQVNVMALANPHAESKARERGIGPVGTVARLVVGLGLLTSVTWGHLVRGFHPWSWALGLLGFPMLLAALRGYGGCEVLAVGNWLLRRDDQIGCAPFWPIDRLERHWTKGA